MSPLKRRKKGKKKKTHKPKTTKNKKPPKKTQSHNKTLHKLKNWKIINQMPLNHNPAFSAVIRLFENGNEKEN